MNKSHQSLSVRKRSSKGDMGDLMATSFICLYNSCFNVNYVDLKLSSLSLIIFDEASKVTSKEVSDINVNSQNCL